MNNGSGCLGCVMDLGWGSKLWNSIVSDDGAVCMQESALVVLSCSGMTVCITCKEGLV